MRSFMQGRPPRCSVAHRELTRHLLALRRQRPRLHAFGVEADRPAGSILELVDDAVHLIVGRARDELQGARIAAGAFPALIDQPVDVCRTTSSQPASRTLVAHVGAVALTVQAAASRRPQSTWPMMSRRESPTDD